MTEPRFLPDEHFRMAAGKAIGVSSITLGLYAILILPAVGLAEVLIQDFILHSALPAIGFGIFALIAVPRQPFNNSVWVAVWAGLISGISVAGYATMFPVVVSSGVESNADAIGAVTPAELPPVAAVLYSFVGLALLAIILILCVGLLLFPDGQLPSPRWRWVAWGSMATSLIFAGAIAHEFRPSSNTPLGSGSGQWTGGGRFVDDIAMIAVGFSLVSLISLGLRYRGSVGLARQQYRWMGLGCGMFIVVLL
ncbi:MAG: hypothetical protein WBM90_07370, partial [Acidimicrobiia bacterium]